MNERYYSVFFFMETTKCVEEDCLLDALSKTSKCPFVTGSKVPGYIATLIKVHHNSEESKQVHNQGHP